MKRYQDYLLLKTAQSAIGKETVEQFTKAEMEQIVLEAFQEMLDAHTEAIESLQKQVDSLTQKKL